MSRSSIWIDLENSPHAAFFAALIPHLVERGHEITVTARSFCQTLGLAELHGLGATAIGEGYELDQDKRSKYRLYESRAVALHDFARERRFDLALNLGSRSQALAAKRLGLPLMAITDYEHASYAVFDEAREFLIPTLVPSESIERQGVPRSAIVQYPGLKEEMYLASAGDGDEMRRRLAVAPDEVLVTLRPISETAHYLGRVDQSIEASILERLGARAKTHVLLLPRTEPQRRRLAESTRGMPSVRLLEDVVHGPTLIAASDLVVSGGGTMIREAAVLGVPCASYFPGTWGAVDDALAACGRLARVLSAGDLQGLGLARRAPVPRLPDRQGSLGDFFVSRICALLPRAELDRCASSI